MVTGSFSCSQSCVSPLMSSCHAPLGMADTETPCSCAQVGIVCPGWHGCPCRGPMEVVGRLLSLAGWPVAPTLALEKEPLCHPTGQNAAVCTARSIVHTSIGGLCMRSTDRPPFHYIPWANTVSCPLKVHVYNVIWGNVNNELPVGSVPSMAVISAG